MTANEKTQMRARMRGRYKRRILSMCKLIGIDEFSPPDMVRLLNRLMLVKGDAATDPDLRVLVRLYNRELIGRQGIPPRKQKEILT